MAFKKGQSGNPLGRPRKTLPDGRHLSDLAKEYTEAAISALADILSAKNASAAAKVQAASALLDRAWGRPAQTLVAEMRQGQSIEEIIAASRQRVIDGMRRIEQEKQICAEKDHKTR